MEPNRIPVGVGPKIETYPVDTPDGPGVAAFHASRVNHRHRRCIVTLSDGRVPLDTNDCHPGDCYHRLWVWLQESGGRFAGRIDTPHVTSHAGPHAARQVGRNSPPDAVLVVGLLTPRA